MEYFVKPFLFLVPRTGLEPACLSALAPETSASTIPPPGLLRCKVRINVWFLQARMLDFQPLRRREYYAEIILKKENMGFKKHSFLHE